MISALLFMLLLLQALQVMILGALFFFDQFSWISSRETTKFPTEFNGIKEKGGKKGNEMKWKWNIKPTSFASFIYSFFIEFSHLFCFEFIWHKHRNNNQKKRNNYIFLKEKSNENPQKEKTPHFLNTFFYLIEILVIKR